MKVIIVSGTPGTGKTRIAKLISKNSSYIYIDVNKLIKTKTCLKDSKTQRVCQNGAPFVLFVSV